MEENCKLNHFKIYCDDNLNKMKKYINDIKDYFNNSLKLCESLLKEINNYQLYLDKIDYNIWHNPNELKSNDIYEALKINYDLFNEQTTKNNVLFQSIEDEFNKVINFEFYPEDESAFDFDINNDTINPNNIYDNNSQKMQSYLEFADDKKDSNSSNLKKNIERNNKCSICGMNNIEFVEEINNNFYCSDCYNKFKYKIDGKEIDQINKDKANKIFFLNSIENIIKYILLKCNDLLNEEKINKKCTIKKKIDYPIIGDKIEDYVHFLMQINEINKGDINITNFNLTSLNEDIRAKIGNIFKQNIELNLNFAQNNLILEDDDDIDDVEDEACYLKPEKFGEKEKNDENILNNFYYFINIISKNNIKFNENIKINILNKLKIKIDPNNFLASNNSKYFIDNFVRTDNFLNLSLDQIKNIYPNLEVLHEYKNIFDYLIKECNIKDFIDFKGNFIIKINNKDKTKEKYYPPYEWIGIGLKVLGKYDNDEWLLNDSKDNKWAIAYHGVGRSLSIKQVKDKLEKKIKEGLKQGKSQIKCHLEDIRHPGKQIGTGVYLTPNINIVENYSGIITFNKERYKVALMAKVEIDKIRESKDINFWVLNSEYIRIYRILLKKINK